MRKASDILAELQAARADLANETDAGAATLLQQVIENCRAELKQFPEMYGSIGIGSPRATMRARSYES